MRLADFGQTMRKYRTTHNMTQEELADILNVQTKYISFLENGHRNPSPELQKKFEDMIMADEMGEELMKQDRMLRPEEVETQLEIYHKLCRLKPRQRENALELIYQILDAMTKSNG